MSYINPNLLQQDWDNTTGWTGGASSGATVSISPAGQLFLDFSGATNLAAASESKDIGTIGTGNYYVEMRFKGDKWDGYNQATHGVSIFLQAGTHPIFVAVGNGFSTPTGDGVVVRDSAEAYQLVISKTWDNNWHTIVLFIHNNQDDMDIWIDKNPSTEAANATDVSTGSTKYVDDGYMTVGGRGANTIQGSYHIDYNYVGTELIPPSVSVSVAESVSVSDIFSSFIPHFTVSVSDSVTVSESTSFNIISQHSFSTNDSISISENTSLIIISPLSFSTNDSISISENTSLDIISPQNVDVSDQIIVSEDINLYITALYIDSYELLSAIEDTVFYIPLYLDIIDNVSISEYISVWMVSSSIDFESIVVSEYVNLQTIYNLSAYDSVTITASISAEPMRRVTSSPLLQGSTMSLHGTSVGASLGVL